uniref:GDT1 family protein n=1 Tax=Mesocestoides corti TaxID=53468 RepID=A0A5K3FSV5_MESCO
MTYLRPCAFTKVIPSVYPSVNMPGCMPFCVCIVGCSLLCSINAAVVPLEGNVNGLRSNGSDNLSSDSNYQGFLHAFLASIYVILISELGDKTFFIAAILSVEHPRSVVYAGAMLALITMTVLSALLGFATDVLPRVYTYYMSGFVFMIFGIKMLRDGKVMLVVIF